MEKRQLQINRKIESALGRWLYTFSSTESSRFLLITIDRMQTTEQWAMSMKMKTSNQAHFCLYSE